MSDNIPIDSHREDVSKRSPFNDDVMNQLYSLPYPPPIAVQTVDSNDVRDIPGILERDLSGKAKSTWVKQFLMYKKFAQFLVDVYDNWIDVRLPEQLANITIDLPDGSKIRYLYVQTESPKLKTSHAARRCSHNPPEAGSRFLPSMAKELNATYAISVYARPCQVRSDGIIVPLTDGHCHIGDIPLMLGSRHCYLHDMPNKDIIDIGEDPDTSRGYFIVEGRKKVIMNFEKVRLNKALLYRYKGGEVICRTTFESHSGTSIVELSFDKDRVINIFLSSLNYYDNKIIKGSKKMDPRKDKKLNVFHIFNYLAETRDENGDPMNLSYQQILDYYILPFVKPEYHGKIISELAFTLVAMNNQVEDPIVVFMDKMEAPDRESTKEEIDRILDRDLFPTLNDIEDERKNEYKLFNLGAMVARICEYMAGLRQLDNRDLWINKRLESAGRMMEQFFRILWGHLLKKALEIEMKNQYTPLLEHNKRSDIPHPDKTQPAWLLAKLPQFGNKKEGIDYRSLAASIVGKVKYENVTELFKNAFSKAWQIRGVYRKENVVQELKTDNKIAALSHLLRIDIESEHQGTVQEVRHMQPDQYGFICIVQTPEGGPCGLVKNLAITAAISKGMGKEFEIAFLEKITALRNIGGQWVLNIDPKLGEYRISNGKKYKPDVYINSYGGQLDGRFFFNGRFLGWCNSSSLYKKLYRMKVNDSRKGSSQEILPPEVSITKDTDNNVNVYTDNSRLIRPLLLLNESGTDLVYNELRQNPPKEIIQKLKSMYPDLTDQEIYEKGYGYNYNFGDLLAMGGATYVDPEEQNYIKLASFQKNIKEYFSEKEVAKAEYDRANHEYDIAKSSGTKTKKELQILELEKEKVWNKLKRLTDPRHRRYTHCELHPQAILGVAASVIPMPQTDQAARATFQSGMGTQALSTYHPNKRNHLDGKTKQLAFPANPIVTTEMENLFGLNETPLGQNTIIAFSSQDGMTGEDAFIFSQRAIDMGKFRIIKYIPYTVTINPRSKLDQLRRPRDNEFSGEKDKEFYHAIEDNGLPSINAELKPGDVVISSFRTDLETKKPINTSVTMGTLEEGVVDSVKVTEKPDGSLVVRVVLRKARKPKVGDKFAARNAQKGTISRIIPTEDMPFTASGMIPDVIVNPHSIPGRMTMEYMIELLTGKVGALTGERVNGTPYEEIDLDRFFEILRELGYSQTGTEIMYQGISGRQMEVPIFIGPAFFQALRHHVDDKYQARGKKGGIKAVTHQPTEGRSKGGGIRFGEIRRCDVATRLQVRGITGNTFKLRGALGKILVLNCQKKFYNGSS